MSGWIKVHRKLKDSSFYKDSQAIHLWLHLLLCANHKEADVLIGHQIVNVKPGQFITGRKKLSEATGIKESKIQRVLKVFEKCSMIEQQTFTKYRVISITNFAEYQLGEQQTNSKRTRDEQQVNINKNDKNNKNNKNDKNNKTKSLNKFNDDDIRTANYISSLIQQMDPGRQLPNIEAWANTIRLMVERDNRTHKEICKVFKWANNDSFWSTNILSPSKLREKYDNLRLKMNNPARSGESFMEKAERLQSGFINDDFIEGECSNGN